MLFRSPYPLTAFGVTTSGSESFATITIDVERSDLPVEITPAVREIIFQAEGERDAIDLAARFDDGAEHSVGRSSRVAYESSDPTVATVDSAGIVTGVAEGEADVTATYGPPDAGISATIPVSVPPSILAVTPQTIDFGTQAVGSSATQQMTITNNGSGDLTVPDVATSGDYSQSNSCVASSPLAPGGSCTISITFAPTAAGPRPGAVNIKTSFHVVPVAIMLAGTGVS